MPVDNVVVQGRSGSDRELLDTASLVGHLVPAGSVYAFLAEHRGVVFSDGLFADLFPSGKGRPSVPGAVIASVLVLQTLHDYSDAEAMDALRCDLRWKVACGLPIDHGGFHPTTLTVWRNRLRGSDRPERIFEAVRAVIAETGVLKGKHHRALDSVVLDDAVATQDTVTQLIAAVRRVRREVPGAAELIAKQCHAHDWDDPGKPAIAWNDQAAREALVSALVNDATLIVDTLHHTHDGDGGDDGLLDPKAAQALALLALVAGQDVEPADGSDGTDGRWRIARKVAEDRTISTVDTDTRHVHKSVHHRQDGYKAHLAVEPDSGLVTAAELTKANGEEHHEAVVGLALLDEDTETGPFEVLGDAAYGTGEARAALGAAGHTAIIKPSPLRPAVKAIEGGFTVDDFTVDEAAGTLTCPNQVTRPISPTRRVTFGAACRGCPLRPRCTTRKDGRAVTLHPHDALLRQARHDWTNRDDLRAVYRRYRPMVERSIAWLIGPKGRCRQLRYRGIAANDLWLHHRIAALNLRRMLNLGLTHTAGRWALI